MKLIRELTGGHVEIALHKKLSGGIVGIGASGLDAAEGGEQRQKDWSGLLLIFLVRLFNLIVVVEIIEDWVAIQISIASWELTPVLMDA
ncbi:hypothetical protein L6452_34063 [Arctium lappa]|uniref:Uncharacterized protein n=1 Tax=Arctium lappa TaxID=4217 RepID=A0ACB8YIB6_ARCLA|nr:hypothetical protein L6452_34063 [Arctium lappa]